MRIRLVRIEGFAASLRNRRSLQPNGHAWTPASAWVARSRVGAKNMRASLLFLVVVGSILLTAPQAAIAGASAPNIRCGAASTALEAADALRAAAIFPDRGVLSGGVRAGQSAWIERWRIDPGAVEQYRGLSLALILVLIAAATLISEDLTCIGAGMLAATGTIDLLPAILASFAGILFGDVLLYLAGRWLGRPALQYPPLKWFIRSADLDRASQWFDRKGPVIILTSRFLPGSRLPTYFGAGILRTGFGHFLLYFTIAAALWTPLLVGLSAVIGDQMLQYYDKLQRYGLWTLPAAGVLIWLFVRTVVSLFSYRGRRLLYSSACRKLRWEFWPPYVFYIPVVAYCVGLALRHRGATVFTAANPAIPDGGFIGESKAAILDGLRDDGTHVARYRKIRAGRPPEEMIREAAEFLNSLESGLPSREALFEALESTGRDMILQEFVDGPEYGIFYVRHPDQDRGHILSITDKRLLKVFGDGRSSLEELILADPRAVCMAPLHLEKHAGRLNEVPPAGREIQLVEVGTHCRGALFLDGSEICTPELTAAIDRISRRFEGFYFGRYDVRCPEGSDIRAGDGFKIVELNGVTSEATHIYDPKNSLREAYRVLMHQWRWAFAIGAANRSRGAKPTPLREIMARIFQRA